MTNAQLDTATPAAATAAAAFVDRFATVWSNPSVEGLEGLVHQDIEFIQPLEAPVRGHQEAAAFWGRLFKLIPDLKGEVLSWSFRKGIVYIELRMFGTLGGKPVEWVTLDRIRLEDGRVRQRVAYFNPIPIALAVLLRPRAWPTWLAGRRQH